MKEWVGMVVAAAAAGCFDFDAAGRCYGDPPGCSDGAVNDASRCPGLAVALCDGFEEPSLNPVWERSDAPPSTTVEIDSSRAYRGQSALRVQISPTAMGESQEAEISESRTETPTPLESHWIRAYLFMPSASLWIGKSRIIWLAQSTDPYYKVELEIIGGFLAMDNDIADSHDLSRTPMPTDRWVCVEMEVTAGQIRVSLDGSPVEDLDLLQDTTFSPPVGSVKLGASLYEVEAPEPAVEFWIDEIVIDSQRGSCDT